MGGRAGMIPQLARRHERETRQRSKRPGLGSSQAIFAVAVSDDLAVLAAG